MYTYDPSYPFWRIISYHKGVSLGGFRLVGRNRIAPDGGFEYLHSYTLKAFCVVDDKCVFTLNNELFLSTSSYLNVYDISYNEISFFSVAYGNTYVGQFVMDDKIFNGDEVTYFDYIQYLPKVFSPFKCFGINCLDDADNICSGHGVCSGEDYCCCNDGYGGNECQYYKCFGYEETESSFVCSGRGDCLGVDICKCNNTSYGDENCASHICNGKLYTDKNVCSGNGNCTEGLSNNHVCTCKEHYIGDNCEYFKCFEYSQHDENVCSNHGFCVAPQECICKDGYSGETCNVKIQCYGKNVNDLDVCNGNGRCLGINNCSCYRGYEGKKCEKTISNLGAADVYYIYLSSISVLGTFVIVLIVIVMLLVIALCFSRVFGRKSKSQVHIQMDETSNEQEKTQEGKVEQSKKKEDVEKREEK